MNNSWNFFVANFPLLMQKTWEQIYLAGTAILVAIIITIPLGIWIARKNKLRRYMLSAAGIMQTIPSLALLGFLLPFLGIGIKTAIVTLTVYSLLPILSNTVTGILNVSPTLIEAADGLGFTKFQKMWLVELPLALPVIVAGIRTATAMSVGIATLAAFIGAGGLGDFIYQGLSLNNTQLILLGAIPAALLALFLDFLISRIEKILIEQRGHRTIHANLYITAILSILALVFLLIYMPVYFWLSNGNQNKIRIASKNFSEQLILGEILSQFIEANSNLKVVRKLNLGGSIVCHEPMLNNQIDMYPEYTGTAYTVILKQTSPQKNLYDYVKNAYATKFNITWLPPFGFNNSNALAIKKDFSISHNVKNIAQLSPWAMRLIIGVPPDFLQREDGFLGLQRVYHLKFASVRLMDPGLMYKAIQNNEVNIIMAFSTDGRIPAYNLVLLEDDKKLFPRYDAAPIIRTQFVHKHPEIISIMKPLSGKISNAVMQKLNYQVDVQKKSPREVAKNFLQEQKLIRPLSRFAGEG